MRLFIAAFLIVSPAVALAQFPSPEIDTIFPPGGQAGATFQVELTGTDLDDLDGLRFTHPNITAQPVLLPADEIWPDSRPDGLKLTVHIADDVPAGLLEVRTLGRYGLSTPRLFVVSPKDGPAELTVADGNETIDTATPLALEQVVNAQTTANRSDHYTLSVRKGQRILVHVWGERLDSRIDATVAILDPAGQEVAASLDETGLDPLGDFTAQVDGDYVIKVSDYLFNGGPPYYYRLMATTAPWLDGVFPPSGKPGTRQKFVLYGRNLPGGQASEFATPHGSPLETKEVEIEIPATGDAITIDGGKILQAIAEGFEWREGGSNPVRIGLARDELIAEDSSLGEQTVHPPCEVVGRFDESGDQDRYRFSATKGEALVIDVIADRMAVAVDPTLILQQIVKPTSEAPDQKEPSKFIAEEDDIVMKSLIPQDGAGFDTRSRDARLLFTAPEDGEYRIVLGNNMSHAGVLAPYRLGIRTARPGFRLIAIQDKNWQEQRNAMPGVTRLNAGGTTFIRILAIREDGFDGSIELSVRGLPPGVYAPPMSVWGPNDEGYLVLSAAPHAQDWTGEVEITGKAAINGKEVSVPALSGTLVWSAQDPTRNRTRSRLTSRFPLQVSSDPAGLVLQLAETRIWRAELKKTLELPVKLTKGNEVKGPFNVTPYGLPGFTRPPTQDVSGDEGLIKINFNQDGNNRPVVSEGRFVFRVDGVQGKNRINPEAADRWASWLKHIDALANRLNGARNKADNAVNTANNARTNAEKAVADHSTTRNNLAQALADAQAMYDAARRDSDAAEAAAKVVPEAWLAAVKSARDANPAARRSLEQAATDAQTKADAAKKAVSDTDAALKAELAAQEEKYNTLQQEVDAAKASLKTIQDTVAAAEKAFAGHLAPRVGLANAAAVEEIRLHVAKRAAALAESEVTQVIAEHEAATKALAEARAKADEALKNPEQTLANASKAVTDKETARTALEKALAEARTKLDAMKKAVADADAAIAAAVDARQENLTELTEARTRAETEARNAEAAVTAATRPITEAELALVGLRKTQAEAQAKFDEAKKIADDAAAAIPAEAQAHAANLATLTAARETTAQALQAAEPVCSAAVKLVTDHDAVNGPLEQAVTDAKAKIEPARKAVTDAEAKVAEMESDNAREQALAKLTADKRAADLALVTAEAAMTSADQSLAENQSAADALAKAMTEAQAAVDAARNAAAPGAADNSARIAELTDAANRAAATLSGAMTALASAKQALAAHDAAKPFLEQAVAEARARSESAKAEAERLAQLVTTANAAKSLAANEARDAQNRANERDVKFTVFSEPIDLRILEPPAQK